MVITRISALQSILRSEHRTQFLYSMIFNLFEQTHKIFSFHPTTVILQGLEVKVPWNLQDGQYPPPHHTFLMMHYFTSIFRAMITTKDSGGDFEMDDDDDDEHYEGLSDPDSEEVHNEQVRI